MFFLFLGGLEGLYLHLEDGVSVLRHSALGRNPESEARLVWDLVLPRIETGDLGGGDPGMDFLGLAVLSESLIVDFAAVDP